jgi:hypothetical protein
VLVVTPKFGFTLRTNDSMSIAEEINLFDSYIDKGIDHIVGPPVNVINRHIWSHHNSLF